MPDPRTQPVSREKVDARCTACETWHTVILPGMPDPSVPARERILDPVELRDVPPTIPRHLTEADIYGDWRCLDPDCGEINHDPRLDLTEGETPAT
jgi:hypothetical protein